MPDTAINRRARCTGCHSIYAIRDAVQQAGPQRATAPQPNIDEGVPRGKRLFLGFGLGIPSVVLLLFFAYWFGIRDTRNDAEMSVVMSDLSQALKEENASEASMLAGRLREVESRGFTESPVLKSRATVLIERAEALPETLRQRKEIRELIASSQERLKERNARLAEMKRKLDDENKAINESYHESVQELLQETDRELSRKKAKIKELDTSIQGLKDAREDIKRNFEELRQKFSQNQDNSGTDEGRQEGGSHEVSHH